jgi:hypothetical protein
LGTLVGVGSSILRNPVEAGAEAARKALDQAGISKPDIVFVFATVGYNQRELLRSIRNVTSEAPLSGCSGEGIITQDTVTESNFGVCVMVIASDELRFSNVRIKDMGEHPYGDGERLAREITPFLAADNLACFVMADSLVFNYDPFLSGFESALKREKPLPLYGGLAADDWTALKTFQYHDDEVFSGGISCVVMSGRGNVECGISHGCVPVGSRHTVTRSKGNIIYEINGVPALEAMKDYFPEGWNDHWSKTAVNLCLGFKAPEHMRSGNEEYVIRFIMGKDDQQGYITIQSEITDGAEVWLARRDKDLIADGIRTISRQIVERLNGRKPKFVLHFDCAGRGKVVFREREKVELLKSLQQDLGEDVPWIGFYSYGEIGPMGENNLFHNFTSVIVAVY